jgi:hypothetical protein
MTTINARLQRLEAVAPPIDPPVIWLNTGAGVVTNPRTGQTLTAAEFQRQHPARVTSRCGGTSPRAGPTTID